MSPSQQSGSASRDGAASEAGTSRHSALVTGATRGIGAAITRHLARNGWDLTLVGRDAPRLIEIQREIQSFGTQAVVVAVDLAQEGAVRQAVTAHHEAYGSMNALILAAGVGSAGPIEGYPLRLFDKQVAMNLRAPFEMIGSALPLLRDGAHRHPEQGGRMIALASIEGLFPDAGLAAYAATKAALLSLVASVNLEEGPRGVTATAISPAFVSTGMSEWVTDQIHAEDMIPVEDIVKVVELALSLSAQAVLPNIVMNRAGTSPYQA